MFDLERQRLFDSANLKYGSHKSRDDGMCAMEMVAYLAGEMHSDHPDCACAVMTGYTIRLNDAMPEVWRQQLKPYLPLLVDTRNGHEIARAELLAWRAIRVFAPITLEVCGLDDLAKRMRYFDRGLEAAADFAYNAYAAVNSSVANAQRTNAARAACMHAARAAHAAYSAGAGRAAHIARAIDASDTADCAVQAARVVPADTIWPLALAALDDALAIGKEAQEGTPVTVRQSDTVEA